MNSVRAGVVEVDTRTGEVRLEGRTVRLQDKPLQLLNLLLETPNLLVTRDEIRSRLWGESRYHDFEDSLNQAVRKLREALRDSASKPRFLETIPRRGYRWIAPPSARALPVPASTVTVRAGVTVGRQHELTELLDAFRSAAGGRGGMVCISGEPGIGKTTLAEDFLARTSGDALTAVGRCSERLVGTEAYLPILEGLENLLRGEDGDVSAALLRETAPSWYVDMPANIAAADAPSAPVPPEARAASQERRKREFVCFLDAVSKRRPLIFFIDDLHWADPSTVDLLYYAGSRCAGIAVLVLGTYRPSDLARSKHPFLDVKLELQAHRLVRELQLSVLTERDVEAYIALEFPTNRFTSEFAAAIYQRTEGSPLFLADLLRDMRNTGVIAAEDGSWVLTRALADIRNLLPVSVRGMVERQIGNVNEAQRRVLEVASIEGYEFYSAVVARVLAITPVEAEELLETLRQKHGLVRFTGERTFPDSTFALRYTFSHVLYQNAVYSSLLPSRRASLSAAVAVALLNHYPGSEVEIAAQLGHLFEAARNWERAAAFFVQAAANGLRRSANREAVDLSLRAIDIARMIEGPLRDRRLLEATLELATARQAQSEFAQSVRDFECAAETAARLGDAEAQVEALCSAAFAAGHLKRTEEMRERALQALGIAKHSGALTAYPESVLAHQGLFVGDLSVARDFQERSVRALRQRPPSRSDIVGFSSLALLNDLQSRYKEADAVIVEALERMRIAGCWSDLLRTTFFHGMVLANMGRVREALETLHKGMQLADLNGERFWFSRFPNTIGWVHGELMDLETALRLNTEGVRAGLQADTPETEANSHINLANAYVATGEFGRAWEHIAAGERILNEDKNKHWMRWRFRIRLGLETAGYWVARGDAAQARASAAAALSHAESVLARKHMAGAHKLLADSAVLEERFTDAAAEYDAALDILRSYPCPFVEWKVMLAAGDAAARYGDQDRGERLLNQAAARVRSLADLLGDERLRTTFLNSPPLVQLRRQGLVQSP